ncbi:MAG TPA: ethanolamine ammonia-lyase subunit EutC [Candidatus Binatia bacterium]|nr:ethanolamine ammonia-lyase subunit EutC [Candidatus Binatia bacterium]
MIDFDRARRTTPARLDVGRAGARPHTSTWLAFQRDHAAARDAVWSEWSEAFIDRLQQLGCLVVTSAAADRVRYINQPPLGRQLAGGEVDRIRARASTPVDIQVVLSDGLSAHAAEIHFERLYPTLCRHLGQLGTLSLPVAVRNGRVAVADVIGAAVGAKLVVHLIGERPGLGTADSLGCYLTFRPGPTTTDADRKCVSNIRPLGLNPDEAGATIAGISQRILEKGSSATDLAL